MNGLTSPNPNVMYEIGIAHSSRLPEEVIIIRGENSKDDPAPFNISHIRWNSFNPDEPAKAINKIKKLIKWAEKEIDLIKDKMLTKIMYSLDPELIEFLVTVREYVKNNKKTGFDLYPFDPDRKGHYGLPNKECSEEYLRQIARKLIELGVLQSGSLIPYWQRIYGASDEYTLTDLGCALLRKIPKMNLNPSRNDFYAWLRSFVPRPRKGKTDTSKK